MFLASMLDHHVTAVRDEPLLCKGGTSCRFHKYTYVCVVVATSPLALNARFTTNGMCAKNNTHIYVARTSNNSDQGMWSLLLLAATVLVSRRLTKPKTHSWSLDHMTSWIMKSASYGVWITWLHESWGLHHMVSGSHEVWTSHKAFHEVWIFTNFMWRVCVCFQDASAVFDSTSQVRRLPPLTSQWLPLLGLPLRLLPVTYR